MDVMNLRNWSIEHTKGLVIGVISPLLFVPIVLVVIGWMQDYSFSQLWYKIEYNDPYRIKVLTIAAISNLIWFYFFLNRENYKAAYGVIFGLIVYAPYIIYIKFF